MNTQNFLLLATFIAFFNSCIYTAEPEIHLIQKGYEGFVIIIFDDPNGQEVKYENGCRVYEIPRNGILKTKFSRQKGWISNDKLKYYYYDKNNRIELRYAKTEKEAKEFYTLCIQNKELSVDVRYLVCSFNQREKCFKEMHKKLDELYPPTIQ